MATLTTSWKSYASASFTGGSATITFYLEAKYSSQSTANNTTNVQTRLRSAFTSGSSMAGAGYKFTCTYANTVSGSGVWTFENEVITSGSSTVTHSSDGTKSITIKASAYNKYWNFTKNLSATVSLPKINRIALIKSGTNFNDEGNPTITFNNPANFYIRPYLNWFNSSGTRVLRIYGTIAKHTSPYTWNLTSEQRTAIRNACNQQNTYNVEEGVQTFTSSTEASLIENSQNHVVKTFSIVDAEPFLTMAIKETNEEVINLLGTDDANVIITNVSKIKVTTTPTPQKGATTSKVVVDGIISGETSQSPYEIEKDVLDVPSNKKYIKATVIDSRGNSNSVETSSTFFDVIDYKRVKQNSFSFKRVNPTSSNVRLQVDSVYYDVNFLAPSHTGDPDIPNVPTVKYKIGEEGSWITIPSTEYDINTDNTLSVDYIIENAINYRDGDTFYIEVSDLLSSWTNKSKVSKGIPVFEFGDDEVQVNGDLLLADINRENVINVRDALGGGGTTDYSLLSNKPQINGVTLSGNKSSSDLGITIPTNYVTTDTTQDITGAKTFKNVMKVQNGQGTGSLWIGGDVNANTLTNNTRHLARLSVPSYSDITLGSTLLGFDSAGDTNMNVTNKGSDVVSFGGMKKITNATSPMAIGFCVANTRNGTTANQKVYPLEMDSNEARFNVQPNYNGTNLATVDYHDSTKQDAITSTNKLDYSLLDNTPTIPTVGNAKTYYGICDTGSFTGTKQVTISNFVLESGATVIIKFTYGNDYTNTPLLQINNETAKYMKIGSNTLTYKWGANAVLTFVYDGTDFILIEPQKATSSIYGLTTLTDSVSSTSTTSSATPNSVKQAYDLADSKQDELVSGTNIKTINNTSLLGSGNINIGGGGTSTDVKINGTSITSGGEADIITEGTYNSSTNKIATMSDLPQDSGWSNVTTSRGTWVYCRYRIVGKQLYLEGRASSLSYSGSATKIGEMPSGTLPSTGENHYFYGHLGGGRIARILVNTSGEIIVDWARNISDGNTYTSATWYSFSTTYFVD